MCYTMFVVYEKVRNYLQLFYFMYLVTKSKVKIMSNYTYVCSDIN